jgi:glycosyltransferase involved in cell wall biosynthesis
LEGGAVKIFHKVNTSPKAVMPYTSAKKSENYCIKEGYKANMLPRYFTDTDTGIIYQPEVYEKAYAIARKHNCQYIIDIGSGNGLKLQKFEKEFKIIAVDHGQNEELIKRNVSLYQFVTANLEKDIPLIDGGVIEKSVVICSDVVEHLVFPDNALRWLSAISYKSIAVVLSTPERDNTRGIYDMGPPLNRAHVREWNYSEFQALLEKYNFNKYTLEYTINNTVSNDYASLLAVSGTSCVSVCENGMDTVSIIVPVYNKEAYIERCFNSIARQRYKKIECIFVEDCSTDRSGEIIDGLVKAYAGAFELKIIKHTENRGLSEARNSGIQAARGEYIYFLDADDEITEHCIEVLAALAKKYQMADIIQGNMRRSPEVEIDGYDISGKGFPEFIGKKLWIKQNFLNIPINSVNKLIRRDFILRNGLYFMPRLIHEDNHWLFTAFKKIRAMAFSNEVCYIRYIVEGSIMTDPNKYPSLESYLKIADEVIHNIDLDAFSLYIEYVNGLLQYGISEINANDAYKDLLPQFTARLRVINQYRSVPVKTRGKLYIKKIIKKILGEKAVKAIRLLLRKKTGA